MEYLCIAIGVIVIVLFASYKFAKAWSDLKK